MTTTKPDELDQEIERFNDLMTDLLTVMSSVIGNINDSLKETATTLRELQL